jgi:hypothetical protein
MRFIQYHTPKTILHTQFKKYLLVHCDSKVFCSFTYVGDELTLNRYVRVLYQRNLYLRPKGH